MDLLVIALLILLGVVMLVVEIALIPGVGATGVIGVLSLAASVFYAFFYLNTLSGWITLLIVIGILAVLFIWTVYSNPIDKVALKKKIDSKVTDSEAVGLNVGDKGIAITRLALIGEAEFDGKRVEVKSLDGFIEEGVTVVIERLSDGVVFVKKVS